jgi:tetratricopeptide (TPR) repeat protein
VRLRHAQYYLWAANHAENNLFLKGDAPTGLGLFDQERTHIDAAWGWARAHKGNPDADALITSYADVTANIGELRYDIRHERIPQLEDALDVARRRGDREREGTVLGNLGNAYRDLGELEKAFDLYVERLAIAREIDDRKGESNALGNLGNVFDNLGEVHKAIRYYNQSLVIKRDIGDLQGEGIMLSNLGRVYRRIGELRGALICYKQAVVVSHQSGHQRSAFTATWNLADFLDRHGDATAAAKLMRACVDFERKINHPDAEKHAARLDQLIHRLAAEGDKKAAEKGDVE